MWYSASASGLQSFSRGNFGYLVLSSTSAPARYPNHVSMFRRGTTKRSLSSCVGGATLCSRHSRTSWFRRFSVGPESASIITTRKACWRLRTAVNCVGKLFLTHCSPEPLLGQCNEATCREVKLRLDRKRRANHAHLTVLAQHDDANQGFRSHPPSDQLRHQQRVVGGFGLVPYPYRTVAVSIEPLGVPVGQVVDRGRVMRDDDRLFQRLSQSFDTLAAHGRTSVNDR